MFENMCIFQTHICMCIYTHIVVVVHVSITTRYHLVLETAGLAKLYYGTVLSNLKMEKCIRFVGKILYEFLNSWFSEYHLLGDIFGALSGNADSQPPLLHASGLLIENPCLSTFPMSSQDH